MGSADDGPGLGDHERPGVSVIIPTYCAGASLSRVISSLDAQSMDWQDFESVFVDDGSPDDTRSRLDELATQRPNMRVTSIPHSGWASRPRNVGLELARGEYVVFMDHDDALYPGALEDAYAYARRHRLDALTAKETKSDRKFFAWDAFLRDVAPPEKREPALLRPMMIHKMYRRGYLLDNDIRFRENEAGVGKVQWEDIHFNLDVYEHGGRLGVLASRPFYQWVARTGSNSSDGFAADPERYWRDLAAVFEHIDKSSIDVVDADWMRTANYTWRVLSMLGPTALKRDDEYFARTLELAHQLIELRIPLRLDDRLEPTLKARSVLLRARQRDLLRSLAECDRGVRAEPVVSEVRLVGGQLHVSCVARWSDASGGPLQLRREEGRLTRLLPPDLTAALPAELLDWSDVWKQATGHLSLSGRQTGVAWPVPAETLNRLVELSADQVTLETRTTAVLDPRTAAMGQPLEPDGWRVACRNAFAGFDSYPYVTYRGPTLVGLLDGLVTVVRASRHQHLVLDVRSDARTVLHHSTPDLDGVEVRGSRTARRLVVPVAGVSSAGSTRMPVRFRLRELGGDRVLDGKGHLVGDDAEVRLELELPHARRLGRGRLRLLVDGPDEAWRTSHGWVTEIVVRVGRGRRFARVSVERVPVSPRRRWPVWG